jgi:NAD(P)-dependent dehydrogenase (short-subunit alcohol dehydrogenase family)
MFYLTKAAVAHMKFGSTIINTASINSDLPNPPLLAYATTKGAIQNLRPVLHSCWLRKASTPTP